MSWRTLILTKPGNCSGERSDCRNKTKITEIEKEMQRVDLLPGAHRRDNQLPPAPLPALPPVTLADHPEGALGGPPPAPPPPTPPPPMPPHPPLPPPPPPRAPHHPPPPP